MFLTLFQPAVDGIVVRCCRFAVDGGPVRLPVVAAKYVVDAHQHQVVVVGCTGAVAACHVAVGEVFGNGVVNIGKRVVVEVAADDNAGTAAFQFRYIVGHAVGLWRSYLNCLGKHFDELL